MITLNARSVATCAGAVLLCIAHLAGAQDLSRYRDIAFGSDVSSVLAITGTSAGTVKVIHQRPALIQELTWRPQYSVTRSVERVEAVKDVTFRFRDDDLYSITVVYDARLVEGLTNADLIDAISAIYGPATVTPAASAGPAVAAPGTINATTVLARWQSADYAFTLMREVYPATFRLIGISKPLEALARAAEAEATRLDKEEAPRRQAEQTAAEAERRKAAGDRLRNTNKDGFRP
jgi:hypothetical protein